MNRYIIFVNYNVMDAIKANSPEEALFLSDFSPKKPVKKTSRGQCQYMVKDIDTRKYTYFTLK